ncbi:monocarboxylate transporter 14-like [Periplaneta americana]|uniref:monocarboxylate transporter 14-like n=1 Tax=Periplaneta americana TaxID=6978 RepID=UPI0037E76030
MERKNNIKQDINYETEAPEGGWGWMIALAVAIMYTVTIGPFACFGLLIDSVLESLGEGTRTLTLISSVNSACSFLLGVLTNYVLTKYTCRQVGIVGAGLFFLGGFISAFARSTFVLIAAYGALQGIGLGFIVPASITSFNRYFVRRRTFVMGATQVTIGVLSMVIPLGFERLLKEYGFTGTQLIISAIGLHSLLSAVLLQPVEKHMKRRRVSILNMKEMPECGSENSENFKQKLQDTDIREIKKNEDENMDSEKLWGSKDIHQNNSVKSEQIYQNSMKNTDGYITNESTQTVSRSDIHKELSASLNVDNTTNNPVSATEDLNITLTGNYSGGSTSRVITDESHLDKNEYQYEEDSTEQHLLIVDKVKVSYSQSHRIVTRNSVSSLRSWTSASKRRGQDQFQIPDEDNSRTSNIFVKIGLAIVEILDLRLLLDPVYVNIAVGLSVSFFCEITSTTLFPVLVLALGYTKADSALCISVLTAADIAGRLFVTLIGAFCPKVPSRTLMLVGAIASVLGRIVLVSFEDFTAVAVLIGFLGFARSFILVAIPLVMAEYDVKRFPAAYGLSMVMVGIISLVAGPFVGWIRDVTDSYPMCINTINALQFMMCILPWILEPVVIRFWSHSKAKEIP